MSHRAQTLIPFCWALLACSDVSNARPPNDLVEDASTDDEASALDSNARDEVPPMQREPRPVDRSELPAESGCLEERTPIAGVEITAIGASADALLAMATGAHTETLTWADGRTTAVTLTVRSARAFWVRAWRDPNYGLLIFRSCRAHVRIEADATLATEDGALNEHFPRLALIAYQPDLLLAATGGIDARDLSGSYAPDVSPDQCFEAVQFDFGLGPTSFGGSMTDQVASDACDDLGPLTAVGARGGARWGKADDQSSD